MKIVCAFGLACALAGTAMPAYAEEAPAVQTFAQLTLGAAESAALKGSPDVALAAARVQEQQALFAAARATYGPALTGNYVETPQGVGTNQIAAQRLTTVGAQVTLGDLLAYSPAIAQANASLQAAQFDFSNAQRSERINVIGLYYGALSARADLAARRAALQSAQADQHASQVRFGAGDVPRLDVVRAGVAVAQAQADVARAQADADNADAALAQETGIDPASLNTAPTAIAPSSLAPSAASAVREALASRPEVASAQSSVDAEQHAVAVAKRGGFPATTLSAGYTKGIDSAIAVSGPTLGVQMNLPLGGAAHDRVAAEEARLAQARAQLAKVQRQITVEVGAAVRTYQAQSSALAAARRALQQAGAAFAATRIGYQSGASSSLDVEAARATYIQSLVSETSALYAQAQAQATLQLLLGNDHA